MMKDNEILIKKIVIKKFKLDKNNLFLHSSVISNNKKVLKYRKQQKGIELLYTEILDLRDKVVEDDIKAILNSTIPKAILKAHILEKQKKIKENGININLLSGVIKEIELTGIDTNTFFNWRLDYCKKLFDNFKTFQLNYGLTLNTKITKKIEIFVNKNTIIKIYSSKERVQIAFKFIELNLKVEALEKNTLNNLIKKSILDFKLGFIENKKYPTFIEILEKSI